MKKYLLLILLFLYFYLDATPQANSSVNISFRDVPESSNSQIYLYLLSNRLGNQSLADSVVVINDNKALLHIPAGKEAGLYTVLLYAKVNGQSVQSTFNFLFDKKNVEFSTCINTPVDSMQVLSSGVNVNYFSFIKQKKYYSSYYSKLLELRKMTMHSDTFYSDLDQQIRKVLSGQSDLFNKIRSDHSDNIAAKYNRWLLSSEIYSNEMNHVEYLRKHFLERFDFFDPLIKNTDMLTTITSSYLFLYKNPGPIFEQQEQQIMAAVDVMMTYYDADAEIVHFVASELEKEFKKLGMEEAMIHVADNYLLNSANCSNSEAKEKLKDEVGLLKQLQPGHKAPNLNIGLKGMDNLYDVKSDTVVILFWATWCSHCQQLVPELYDILRMHSSVKVVAIALDQDAGSWQEDIKKYPDWLHVRANDMWDDSLVVPYAVYATPTIYVLNSDFRILKKINNPTALNYFLTDHSKDKNHYN